MKKTVLVKIFCLVLFAIFMCSIFTSAYASNTDKAINDILTKKVEDSANVMGKVQTISKSVITIFQVVGTGVAVIMLVVLAMKYMMAAPGDKADIKKHAIVYVVGAVSLFAAVGILTIIQKFSEIVKIS